MPELQFICETDVFASQAITGVPPHAGKTTVHSINSCLCPVGALDGAVITTAEGLGNSLAGFHPVQGDLHFPLQPVINKYRQHNHGVLMNVWLLWIQSMWLERCVFCNGLLRTLMALASEKTHSALGMRSERCIWNTMAARWGAESCMHGELLVLCNCHIKRVSY